MPTFDTSALRDFLKDFLKVARENDIPNSFVFCFTALFWPLYLFLWNRRRLNSIPGLEVHFSAGVMDMGETIHSSLEIEFMNHTGSVAYITGPIIRRCTMRLQVSAHASRDVARSAYFLQFLDGSKQFSLREITLQTNATGKTSLALGEPPSQELLSHSTSWLRRRVRWPKFFVIEYTAMIGTKRSSVCTLY